MAAPALSGLTAARAAYGLLLLAAPGAVIRVYSGQRSDRPTRAIARLLGARHLSQAVLTLGESGATVLALGVEVDLAHSASMLGWAALGRSRRRAALVDGIGAATFAVTGAVLARRHPRARPTGPGLLIARLDARRQVLATRLARRALPAALRPPGGVACGRYGRPPAVTTTTVRTHALTSMSP